MHKMCDSSSGYIYVLFETSFYMVTMYTGLHRTKNHICTHIGTWCQNANANSCANLCANGANSCANVPSKFKSVKRYPLTNTAIFHYT